MRREIDSALAEYIAEFSELPVCDLCDKVLNPFRPVEDAAYGHPDEQGRWVHFNRGACFPEPKIKHIYTPVTTTGEERK